MDLQKHKTLSKRHNIVKIVVFGNTFLTPFDSSSVSLLHFVHSSHRPDVSQSWPTVSMFDTPEICHKPR